VQSRDSLPLAPLLYAYATEGLASAAHLHQVPGLGPRFEAIHSATARFLYADQLDTASDDDLREALVRFHDAVVRPPLHTATLRRRLGFVRHALGYLLRGQDSLPAKLEAVLTPTGTYHVPGLGPVFWSAVLQSTAPGRLPGWTPAIVAGLVRLGLVEVDAATPGTLYLRLLAVYDRLRALRPGLTALHLDHFLSLVAQMPGRTPAEAAPLLEQCPVSEAVRRLRAHTPLRQRLKERGQALAEAQQRLEAGLARHDGKVLSEALAVADPAGEARCPLDWGRVSETLTLWIGRLWEAGDPYAVLKQFWSADDLPGAGLWLPAAVLHLRDPQQFGPWDEGTRRGWATLDDAAAFVADPTTRYRLFNEALSVLRERHALHPLEVPAVLAALDPDQEPRAPSRQPPALPLARGFGGFCADTFRFLEELARSNNRDWMEQQRERYLFAVRQPLTELCRALVEQYVGPVLQGQYGWPLDTEARAGRALTSICRNAFGRGGPYNTALWIAFGPPGGRKEGPQLFVRLAADGLRCGLRLGREARAVQERLRRHLDRHAELVCRLLAGRGALERCRSGPAQETAPSGSIATPEELRAWAAGRSLEMSLAFPATDACLGREELVGTVLLTFDALLPLLACCLEEEPLGVLTRLAGGVEAGGFGDAEFQRATFLRPDWLQRARGLLSLKRQLILQGVPGTGKTWVARNLARLLTGGDESAIRLVQFHPAYSYEEFVEGIKVRSVAVEGRHDVTYPVEDGVLCSFAALAAGRPSQPHVLVIDEINRGNLPRIFGELLYLLEYREQVVDLPYSRRGFCLPANLYLLATMNAADRSVALLDQALRRRFSFLEMEPDPAVLSAWLNTHPPVGGPAFSARVLGLFERLNARLRADLGAQAQVGHSYFMVPDLDETRLGMIWQHHVRPLLEEHFLGQPGRAAAYDQLLDPGLRGRNGRREPTVAPAE
jgi:hypothetical protein